MSNKKRVETIESTKTELATDKKSVKTELVTDKKSVSNTDKVNRIISVSDVYSVFVNAVNGKPCKLNYSNAKSQTYCGLPSFSVNMKKTGFSVYMSSENSEICKSIDNTLIVIDNFSDTTKNQLRCKLIKFSLDRFDTLIKCINAVVSATVQ